MEMFQLQPGYKIQTGLVTGNLLLRCSDVQTLLHGKFDDALFVSDFKIQHPSKQHFFVKKKLENPEEYAVTSAVTLTWWIFKKRDGSVFNIKPELETVGLSTLSAASVMLLHTVTRVEPTLMKSATVRQLQAAFEDEETDSNAEEEEEEEEGKAKEEDAEDGTGVAGAGGGGSGADPTFRGRGSLSGLPRGRVPG